MSESEAAAMLAMVRGEVLELRRALIAVQANLFVTLSKKSKDAEDAKRLLSKARSLTAMSFAQAETPQADLVQLRGDIAIAMGNLLLAVGGSREEVERIVMDALKPKAGGNFRGRGSNRPDMNEQRKKRTVEYQGETLELECTDIEFEFLDEELLHELWWRHQRETNPDFQTEWGDLFDHCNTLEEREVLKQRMYAHFRSKRTDSKKH